MASSNKQLSVSAALGPVHTQVGFVGSLSPLQSTSTCFKESGELGDPVVPLSFCGLDFSLRRHGLFLGCKQSLLG